MSKDPQIIMQDMSGFNNTNLEQNYARLYRGGSWKRQRIVMIIPTADLVPARVMLSFMNLAFPANNGVARILCTNQEVGKAYSSAIESVLAHPDLSTYDYILTVEHDNTPEADAVLKLLERMEEHPEFDCISGGYWTKGPGGCFQAWGDCNDPIVNFRPQLPRLDGGLLEVRGAGMGFALFRMSLFKDPNIPKPWFQTAEGCTQDLFFWKNARPLGHRVAIDCSVKVGHMDWDGKYGGIPEFIW